MFKMSEYSFIAGLISVALELGCYVLAIVSARLARRRTVLAGAGAGGGTIVLGGRGANNLAARRTLLVSPSWPRRAPS